MSNNYQKKIGTEIWNLLENWDENVELIMNLGRTRLIRSENWDANVELIRKLGRKCGND